MLIRNVKPCQQLFNLVGLHVKKCSNEALWLKYTVLFPTQATSYIIMDNKQPEKWKIQLNRVKFQYTAKANTGLLKRMLGVALSSIAIRTKIVYMQTSDWCNDTCINREQNNSGKMQKVQASNHYKRSKIRNKTNVDGSCRRGCHLRWEFSRKPALHWAACPIETTSQQPKDGLIPVRTCLHPGTVSFFFFFRHTQHTDAQNQGSTDVSFQSQCNHTRVHQLQKAMHKEP